MVGYAWSEMPDPFPWLPEHYVGIRIHRGWKPSTTLFHEGQPFVFYISPTRTIAAHGWFRGLPYPLEPAEHGVTLRFATRWPATFPASRQPLCLLIMSTSA